MLTDFQVQTILDHLVLRIVEILPVSAAGVTLISPSASPQYIAASDASALRYELLQTELDEGPCLATYRTGIAVTVPDLRTDRRFTIFGPQALNAGLAAVFTFPLRKGDRRLGALDLYRDTPGMLNDGDMGIAQTLADVTSAYLINAQARVDLEESSQRAHETSVHDALTGLPNRTLLLERLDHALTRGRRSERLTAVLFVDLDRFKLVNDVHGHQTGDDLLVAVAHRLTGLLRPGDTLARMSGDEFVILCEDLENQAQVEAIAERVLSAMAAPFDLSGVGLMLSASVGIAFAGRDEHPPERLLQDADIAMYQVKRKGGANHQVIDLREQHVAEHRASLQSDLREAIPRHELRAEYQPIVRTADGEIIGAEALLRWDHPGRGPIPPVTVIELAEQSGLIVEIGRWMLERACVDRHRWASDQGDDSFSMAVNVSAHQLMAPDFVSMVSDVLTDTSTASKLLTLEITESAFVQDADRALIVLTELRELGVCLALDDFGTGYSSLSYLKRFPVHMIKIDQAFVADLGRDRTSRAIVMKIIELAHMLQLVVITEGVETVEQHREVTSLGSDSCQGFYFSRPITADNLDTLLTNLRVSSEALTLDPSRRSPARLP